MTTTERDLLDHLHDRLGRIRNGESPRHIVAEHVRLDPTYGGRIIDALSIDTWGSSSYALSGYEVKTSRSDWLRELKAPEKAEAWSTYCTRWWLVTVPDVVRRDLPAGWGLLELRGSTLRQMHAAPRLNPQPITARQVASIARSIHQTSTRRATTNRPNVSLPSDVNASPTDDTFTCG